MCTHVALIAKRDRSCILITARPDQSARVAMNYCRVSLRFEHLYPSCLIQRARSIYVHAGFFFFLPIEQIDTSRGCAILVQKRVRNNNNNDDNHNVFDVIIDKLGCIF